MNVEPLRCEVYSKVVEIFVNEVLLLDRWLFEKINQHWTNSLLDGVMPIITDLQKILWMTYGVIPIFIGFWIYKQRSRAVRVIMEVIVALALADIIAYRVLKLFFERTRPHKTLMTAILRTTEHVGPSFPSNHAANSFAVATLIALHYPKLTVPLFLLAAVISYSRVYVGVHYPLDVCAGALLGATVALFLRKVFEKVKPYHNRLRSSFQ